jgi:glutaredoxin
MKKHLFVFSIASLLTLVSGFAFLWFTASPSGVAEIEQDNRDVLRANGGRPVVLVSSTCEVCGRAEAWMREKGHDVDQIDVVAEPQRAKPYRDAVGVGAVPVLILPARFIVGFDPEVWDLYLTVERGSR